MRGQRVAGPRCQESWTVLGDDWLPVLPVEQSLSHLSDQLTPEARRVMAAALDEAEELGHGYLGDEHVLLGLLGDDAGRAQRFLHEHGLDLAAARTDLLRLTADRLIPQSRGDDVQRCERWGSTSARSNAN